VLNDVFNKAIAPVTERVKIRDDGLLRCPRCSDCAPSYLHHGDVTVYVRAEDEATTVKTIVRTTGESSIVPSRLSGNPSSRRHGLTIIFECEQCRGSLVLGISQHKGMTYVKWIV
jgi:hypothetical protein